jgi:hypothetical protein
MRPSYASILALAAALSACGGASTESYVDGRWPTSGRWVATEWDGKPVPVSTPIGDVTAVLDSARVLVGPANQALYILDSHMSDGYVGHDTLTGEFVLGGQDGDLLELRIDSKPMSSIAVVALQENRMILMWELTGRGRETYVLNP